MKIRSSHKGLTGCYGGWQVLAQGDIYFVLRADETVVRRGNDFNGAIEGARSSLHKQQGSYNDLPMTDRSCTPSAIDIQV
jgi:hypothetical protein